MKELSVQIIEQQQNVSLKNFLIGFKIDPFTKGLNMHVISDDFYSKSMRRISHWNSFNTELFLTYQTVYALLRVQGHIEPILAEKAKELRSALPLRCNQCSFETEYLLELKGHLLEHWKKREVNKVEQQVEVVIRMLDETKLATLPKKELDKSAVPLNQSKSNQAMESAYHERVTAANPFKVTIPATNKKPPNCRRNMGYQPPETSAAQHPNAFNKQYYKPYHPMGSTNPNFKPLPIGQPNKHNINTSGPYSYPTNFQPLKNVAKNKNFPKPQNLDGQQNPSLNKPKPEFKKKNYKKNQSDVSSKSKGQNGGQSS